MTWALLRQLPEFWAGCLGLLALLCVATMILLEQHFDPQASSALRKILVAHVMLGAPTGIMQGAKYEVLSFGENFAFNVGITIAIIALFNALFGLSCRKFLQIPFLQKTFQGMKGDAHKQRKTWARFGIPGIFVFVFFPMPLTGPVLGSLLARFVGLRFWGSVLTVITASIASIFAWGYAADRLQQYLGDGIVNAALVCVVGLTIGIACLSKICLWLKQRRNGKAAKATDTEPPPVDDDHLFVDEIEEEPAAQGEREDELPREER